METGIRRRIVALAAELSAIELKAADLGRKPGEIDDFYGYGSCSPTGAKRTEVYYPTLDMYDRPEEIKLPDSGKATITYDVTRRSKEERNGKKRHGLAIKVKSIDPIVDEEKPVTKPGLKILSAVQPGMIMLARGDQAIRAILNHAGKVKIPGAEIEAVTGALKGDALSYGRSAREIGNDATLKESRNHIAQSIRGIRGQGDFSGVGRGFDNGAARGRIPLGNGAAAIKAKVGSGTFGGRIANRLAGIKVPTQGVPSVENPGNVRKKLRGGLLAPAFNFSGVQPCMISLDRSRNPMGEFAPQSGGDITPEHAVAAYSPRSVSRGLKVAGEVGGGVAGLAGIAALIKKRRVAV